MWSARNSRYFPSFTLLCSEGFNQLSRLLNKCNDLIEVEHRVDFANGEMRSTSHPLQSGLTRDEKAGTATSSFLSSSPSPSSVVFSPTSASATPTRKAVRSSSNSSLTSSGGSSEAFSVPSKMASDTSLASLSTISSIASKRFSTSSSWASANAYRQGNEDGDGEGEDHAWYVYYTPDKYYEPLYQVPLEYRGLGRYTITVQLGTPSSISGASSTTRNLIIAPEQSYTLFLGK